MGRKKTTTGIQEDYEMKKLTSKGKHTIKVENHLHINMISTPAIMRRAQMQGTGSAFEI